MLHRNPLVLALAAILFPLSAKDKVDLSRLVVVGDSLSAGFQNGSLLETQQVHGYAALIAAQARVDLALPLVAAPGIPNVLVLVSPGPPPIIAEAPGTSTGRVDPTLQAMDLAVPGHTVQDGLTTRPDPGRPDLTLLVLGLPGLLSGISRSQVEWAENLQPTTILCWLGSNDALGAAMAGNTQSLTPPAEFEASYKELMDRLAATGATLVVGNVPDVTTIPFLTSAEKVAAQIGVPLSVVQQALKIVPGDFVTPAAFPLIASILQGQQAGPLPPDVVLDREEVAAIRAATGQYNAVIAAEAQAKGAALVDIHALLARIQDHGYQAGGQRLTIDFLGGIFSLDGIHPTNTGYAIMANEFIQELNTNFAAGIPPVSVEQIFKTDPLVPHEAKPAAAALGHISPTMAKSLREVLVH